ncbi:MAG: hypothetical protein ABJR05_14630 [Balneola sp.]
MISFKEYNINRLTAKLLIVASMLCVLFGNGVHLHPEIDHFFDHGDMHVLVHAHEHSDDSNGEDHHSSSPEDEKHEVAKVDLYCVLAQSKSFPAQCDLFIASVKFISGLNVNLSSGVVAYEFDLPPPDIGLSEFASLSISFRGPPIG